MSIMPRLFTENTLVLNHIGCCRSFGTVNYIKTYRSTLIKRPVTVRLNGGMVNENIRSIFLLDKTKTLGRIKPLYNTFIHFC